MKSKKILFQLTTLLFICALAFTLPSYVQAKSKNKGTIKKGITWSYSSKKNTLTIKGNGSVTIDDLKAATSNNWPVSGDASIPKFNKIVFTKGITKIDIAFFSIEGIKSITLPNTLQKITTNSDYSSINGDYDPWSTTLTTIKINGNNKKFKVLKNVLYSKNGKTLFVYPSGKNVKSYTIPSKVTKIAPYAFYGTDIQNVTMGNKVTSIGKYAFKNSTICKIALSKKLKKINARAFINTGLTAIDLPTTLTSIGNYAFYGCKLTQIILPKNISNLGRYAFANNSTLTAITINCSCDISYSVFDNCSRIYNEQKGDYIYHKIQVHLGSKMNAPVTNLIASLENVITFTADTSNVKYFAKNGSLYAKRGNTLLYTPELSKYQMDTDNTGNTPSSDTTNTTEPSTSNEASETNTTT